MVENNHNQKRKNKVGVVDTVQVESSRGLIEDVDPMESSSVEGYSETIGNYERGSEPTINIPVKLVANLSALEEKSFFLNQKDSVGNSSEYQLVDMPSKD